MQAIATLRKLRADSYRKVQGSRKRRVRGIWHRHGRYFAKLALADDLGLKMSKWVSLNGGKLDEAKADYARLL